MIDLHSIVIKHNVSHMSNSKCVKNPEKRAQGLHNKSTHR